MDTICNTREINETLVNATMERELTETAIIERTNDCEAYFQSHIHAVAFDGLVFTV